MALLDELKEFFALKGETLSKGEIVNLVGDLSSKPKPLTPTDPAPTLDGIYKPTIDGIYANAGGLKRETGEGQVDYGMAVEFIKNGAVWVKNSYPLPIQDLGDYTDKQKLSDALNFDFSDLGGIVQVPEDRSATSFSATPLNPAITYFENDLFFGGNISVKKIYVKSPVDGVVMICFIEVIGVDAQVVWSFEKPVLAGINAFDLSEFQLPEYIISKPKLNIGISERNNPIGSACVKEATGKNSFTILNNGLHPYGTIPNRILNIWAKLDTADFLIRGYRKIDYLSEYKPDNIYKSINSKYGITDFTGGIATSSYFGDGLQVLTNKQKLVKFNFKSTTAGSFEIVFINYAFGIGTIIHTVTKNVMANTLYGWTPSELSLPDLSSYERVYTFLHNINPDTPSATVKLSSSGVNEMLTSFNLSNGTIEFIENSIYRLAYWMDVVNDNANIEDQLKDIQIKVNSAAVASYDELLDAINSQNIVTLKDGNIEIEKTIDVPYGKTIRGSKNAKLRAGTGVDLMLRLGAEDTCLDGFTIIGNGAKVDISSTSRVNLPINIEESPTNIGNGIGILCSKGSGDLRGLRILNFDRAAIELEKTFTMPSEFPKGFNIQGVICEDNYFGIRTIGGGEYSRISDANCLRNVCGISIVSGNIAVSNSHFTQNRIGAHVGGTLPGHTSDQTNNAHGGFSNCFFNHNALRGLYVVNITNGQIFTGCNFFDGIIEFDNSVGAVITGGIIASEIIIKSNSGQLSMITNCLFRSDGGNNAGKITKTGIGRLSMFGNRYSTGKDDILLNQEL